VPVPVVVEGFRGLESTSFFPPRHPLGMVCSVRGGPNAVTRFAGETCCTWCGSTLGDSLLTQFAPVERGNSIVYPALCWCGGITIIGGGTFVHDDLRAQPMRRLSARLSGFRLACPSDPRGARWVA